MAKKRSIVILLISIILSISFVWMHISLMGNFLKTDILGILFAFVLTALVMYHFFDTMSETKIHLADLIYFALVIYISFWYIRGLIYPNPCFDTWQVYDTSRYVFKDFGYMSFIRQHIMNTHYEMAFPPLFPFLMATVNSVFDIGVLASVLLNYWVMLIAICHIKKIGDKMDWRMPMALATCVLLYSYEFLYIFRGGGTQVLGFLLLILIAESILMCNGELSTKRFVFCVFLAAMGIMNRFDFLATGVVIVVFLPVLICMKNKENKFSAYIKYWGISVITMFCGCLPWIIYSLRRFGKIFVTDNGRRLWNVEYTSVTTFFSDEQPPTTIFDDFGLWLDAFGERCWGVIQSFVEMSHKYSLWISAIGLLLIFCFLIKRNEIKFCMRNTKLMTTKNVGLLIVYFLMIAQEVLFIFAGIKTEKRFHIFFIFLMNITVLVLLQKVITNIYARVKGNWKNSKRYIFLLVLCFLVLLPDAKRVYPSLSPRLIIRPKVYPVVYTLKDVFELNEQEKQMEEYLLAKNCSCLAINRSEYYALVPRIAALLDLSKTITPTNLSQENAETFFETFDIDFIYSSDIEMISMLDDAVKLTQTPFENLYEITIP